MANTSVKAALDRQTAQIALAGSALDSGPLFEAARKAAVAVKRQAVASGAQIAISVGRTNNGVRIIVRGPGANKYRALLNAAITKQLPGASALVKASIIKAAKL